MQYDFGTIDPFTDDGVELANMLNSWRNALYTMQRGAARPAFAVPGMAWVNDAAGPTGWLVNLYLGAAGDVALFSVDTVAGTVELMAGVDIEAAGALLSANNLSDLANVITARSNLELGALATKNTVAGGDIALAAQAQGDLMWFDAGVWKRVPAGIASAVLTSQGPGVVPIWGPGSTADKLGNFLAKRTIAATAFGTVGITVNFDSVTQGNTGGFYNATTGIFTPPAGRWLIGFNILSGSASGGTNETFELRKNGTPIASAQQSNGGGSVSSRGTSLWVDANGTDQFSVYIISNPGTSNVLPEFVAAVPATQFWAFQGDGLPGATGPAGTPSGVTPPTFDEYTSAAGLAANIPQDDTIPQIGEGTQIFGRTFTASNAAHRIRVRAAGSAMTASAASIICAALFIDGAANAVRSKFLQPAGGNWGVDIEVMWEGVLAAGAHTFTVRLGAGVGSVAPNASTTRLGGGSQAWTFTIEELTAP